VLGCIYIVEAPSHEVPTLIEGFPMQTLFADIVSNISMTGNLVRVEFATLTPSPAQPSQQSQLVPSNGHQLVMPLEGFLRFAGMHEQLVKKLVANGVLKQAPAAADPSTAGVSNNALAGTGLVS